MTVKRKDLLGIYDLSKQEIIQILQTAEEMKTIILKKEKKTDHLKGISVVTLFYENSTRTRLSFELASKYMSAASANIAVGSSSVAKGESLLDTGRTIDRMGTDLIIIRHSCAGAPHFLARNLKASIINAGDGMNEHPTQALLDMLTIKENNGSFEGLKVAIIGDIAHSRVARSNIYGLAKLGAHVAVAGPPTLMPKGIEQFGVKVFTDIDKALADADVVMGLRLQTERQKSGYYPSQREYARFFGINQNRLENKKVLILHPGPVNRGVEMSTETVDSCCSQIDQQVTNGVAVRMAVMHLFSGKEVEVS